MSTPAERIRDALKSVCSSIPAGRSLRASADAALAALAELERERDELRVALSIFYHAHESGNSVPPHICADAEKLIARPTRKDGE